MNRKLRGTIAIILAIIWPLFLFGADYIWRRLDNDISTGGFSDLVFATFSVILLPIASWRVAKFAEPNIKVFRIIMWMLLIVAYSAFIIGMGLGYYCFTADECL